MPHARPIICAVDDSEASRHAARAATWLARELEADLVLAHAFDPLGIPTMPSEEMLRLDVTDDDLERTARRRAHKLLENALEATQGSEVETEIVEGQPVHALRRLASERRAALLVAGTAARGGLDRILLGSVSSELAAGAPCPLVAVPRGAALEQSGPVVAGYDGSEHSLRAARHGAAAAALLGRELVLVHVTGEEGVRPGEELVRELYTAAKQALGEYRDNAALDLDVRLSVEDGDPVQTIAAVAAEQSAAVIVTGARGRNVLSSALLGSVSAGLVRAARCPVVLVPESAGEILAIEGP